MFAGLDSEQSQGVGATRNAGVLAEAHAGSWRGRIGFSLTNPHHAYNWDQVGGFMFATVRVTRAYRGLLWRSICIYRSQVR